VFLALTLVAYPLVAIFVLFGGGALPWFKGLYRKQAGSAKGWTVFATAHVVGGGALFVSLVALPTPFDYTTDFARLLLGYFIGLVFTLAIRALR